MPNFRVETRIFRIIPKQLAIPENKEAVKHNDDKPKRHRIHI